jgi:hypothetical protein
MSDALEQLGMDLAEVLEIDDSLRTRPAVRDGRICICGHGVSRHAADGRGNVLCTPSKMTCPCMKVRPVLDSDDTRPFLRRTQGAGPEHALIRGLARVLASGKKAEWLEVPTCQMPGCGSTTDVLPVPVSERGHPLNEASGFNVFMCKTCLYDAGGVS